MFENYTILPTKLTRSEAPHGFSIDCGYVLTKLLYPKNPEIDKSIVFLYFPTLELEKNLQQLVPELRKHGNQGTINVRITGVKSKYAKAIVMTLLRSTVTIVDEIVAIGKGFDILTENVEESEILYDDNVYVNYEERFDKNNLLVKRLTNQMNSRLGNWNSFDNGKLMAQAIVMWAGANVKYYLLGTDGSMKLIHTSTFGGQTYLGLAKLFIDSNDYEVVTKHSNKGLRENVDLQFCEMINVDPSSPYGTFPLNLPIISFGKCDDQNNGKENFAVEDILDALTYVILGDHLFWATQLMQTYKTGGIYIGGYAFSAPAFRKHLTLRQTLIFGNIKIVPINCNYLPALGALYSE